MYGGTYLLVSLGSIEIMLGCHVGFGDFEEDVSLHPSSYQRAIAAEKLDIEGPWTQIFTLNFNTLPITIDMKPNTKYNKQFEIKKWGTNEYEKQLKWNDIFTYKKCYVYNVDVVYVGAGSTKNYIQV